MACTKAFVLSTGGDLPLDAAIFSATLNKIVGVRSHWIYLFNATTGAKEAEFRYAAGVINEASVAECGGFLYVATWRGLFWNPNTGDPHVGSDIYKINLGLTTSSALGLNVIAGLNLFDFAVGFTGLVTDGTFLYGIERGAAQLFQVNPAVPASYTTAGSFNQSTPLLVCEYDGTNGVIWASDSNGSVVNVINTDMSGDAGSSDPIDQPLGVVRIPTSNLIFVATGTQNIWKCFGADTLPPPLGSFSVDGSPIVLGVNDKPVRLRYRPSNTLIYIPCPSTDLVYTMSASGVLNPTPITGFSDPFDVVITPSKAWAVQQSGTPLREIV